jgi:cell division transport system permease protein
MKRRFITGFRIIRTGVVNFIRNISLAIAAIAVMVITLTILLFSLITNVTFNNEVGQLTNEVDVSVYLKDTTTNVQAQRLIAQVGRLSNVKRVTYLDKAQALQAFLSQNSSSPNLAAGVTALGANPIYATIHVYPKDLNNVGTIENFLTEPSNLALQSSGSPSYSGSLKEAINNIAHATDVLREIGVIAIIVFAVVSILIIFNTIQMAIFNRRDELTIMRLLGASGWYIRGPFIVESAIYGLISALLSVVIINTTFAASSGALQASSLGLLDINYANVYFTNNFTKLLTLQILIGIVIGAVSSLIATQRYLKFKTAR